MSKRSKILKKRNFCRKHTISLVKFLLREKSHFHCKRTQYTAHVCTKAKLAEIMASEGCYDVVMEYFEFFIHSW
jgi:hypothetical protein